MKKKSAAYLNDGLLALRLHVITAWKSTRMSERFGSFDFGLTETRSRDVNLIINMSMIIGNL